MPAKQPATAQPFQDARLTKEWLLRGYNKTREIIEQEKKRPIDNGRLQTS
jgi:hypothetical protein